MQTSTVWISPSSALKAPVVLLALLLTAIPLLAAPYDARPFTAAEDTVSQAYIAYYGRAADPAGLAYWSGRLEESGGNLDAIIEAFGESREFVERFGGLSTQELITNLYQQLLNRAPDSAGLAYYTGELEAGRRTLQSIALDVLYGATGDDESTVANKLAVARHFTSVMEEAPGDVVAEVDADAMAALIARVSSETERLARLNCEARAVTFGETPGMIDGRSAAQQAFTAARGAPDLFSLSFITEQVDTAGLVAERRTPTRLESWVYNRGRFLAARFENGYFIDETDYGDSLSLPPTPYTPEQFRLCMDEAAVTELMGEPNCTEDYNLAGRAVRLLRYNPTTTRPAATVALEDGLLMAVTAGYALTDGLNNSNNLCP
jgi:hypothetical protein